MREAQDEWRALRRAHNARLKKNRRWHWRMDHAQPGFEVAWSKIIKTPTFCSCWMCGNPRKYFGELTVQERRVEQRGAFPDPWQAYRDELAASRPYGRANKS